MKKVALLSAICMTILFALVLVINPKPVNGEVKAMEDGPGGTLPDSIQKFVQRACMDCHADDGNFMAKGKINFSAWAKYDSAKQIGKAAAICKNLTKSSMPPKKWRANNPDDVPTQAEVEMVCRWAKSLQK